MVILAPIFSFKSKYFWNNFLTKLKDNKLPTYNGSIINRKYQEGDYFFDNNGNIFRLTDANFLYKYGVLINIYSDILEFCGKINTNSDNTLL